MLPGFENITHDLTDYERDVLVPLFVRGLRKKVGVKEAVTNKKIVDSLKQKGFKVTDARVRKIINYIRRAHLIEGLVASSRGYYITRDPVEIKRYIQSLDGRENEIHQIKEDAKAFLRKLLGMNSQSQINF